MMIKTIKGILKSEFQLCLIAALTCALSFPVMADSSFLNALNKTISKINASKKAESKLNVTDKNNQFLEKAKASLSASELELIESDLEMLHEESNDEIDKKYREAFAKKSQAPVSPADKEQMEALKALASGFIASNSKDIQSKFLANKKEASSKQISSVRAVEEQQTKAKPLEVSQPELREIPKEDWQTDDFVYVDGRGGSYKLPIGLSEDQRIIESVIDHQKSERSKDSDDSGETELFERISKAYKKQYRNFSKRIEADKELSR